MLCAIVLKSGSRRRTAGVHQKVVLPLRRVLPVDGTFCVLSLSAMQNPLTNVSEGGLVMGCVVVVVVVIVIDVDELELGRLVVGAIRNQVVGKKLVVT